MDNWCPLFAKIVDSSLWKEDDVVVKVFLTMMAKKDKDHVCRGTAFNIGEWAKKTELQVIEAIKVLCSPDLKRIEPQPFDGRRLQRVEDGWLILNGDWYDRLAKRQMRREYKRIKQSEYRRPGYQKKEQREIVKRVPILDPPYVKPDGNGETSPPL